MSTQRHQKKIYEDLFRYWYRPLCVYALHYLEDIGQAEDTVQECYLRLWEKSSGICGTVPASGMPENPKAYLYSAVRNRCLDIIRKRKSSGECNGVSLDGIQDAEVLICTDETLQEDSVTEARLWTAIDSLPEKCREIFLMAKRDGLKYEEIARELDISENTVRNQVSKALRILKEGARKIIYFFLGL